MYCTGKAPGWFLDMKCQDLFFAHYVLKYLRKDNYIKMVTPCGYPNEYMYKTGCPDACNWYSFQYYGNTPLCVMPMYLSECAGFHHLGGSVRECSSRPKMCGSTSSFLSGTW